METSIQRGIILLELHNILHIVMKKVYCTPTFAISNETFIWVLITSLSVVFIDLQQLRERSLLMLMNQIIDPYKS